MFLYWMIDVIPAYITIIDLCLRKKYTEIDLFNLLLIVGNVQGLLAMLTFVSPEFQSFFINRMLAYGFKDIFLTISSFRMYGMSSGLTFSTPIVQSTLAMIAVYLLVNKNIKYMWFVPLLAFSAIINARTSIVIMMVGIVAIFLSSRKLDLRRLSKVLILVCMGVAFVSATQYFIKISSPLTYDWIDAGIQETTSFLKGDATGYFDYVTNEEQYILPSGSSFLFGVGMRIMGTNKYRISSDVGWINDVWMGGIIYAIVIYIFYCRILIRLYHQVDSNAEINKFLSIFFFGIFLFGNFKGYIISLNDFTTVFFLIYLFVISKQSDNSACQADKKLI